VAIGDGAANGAEIELGFEEIFSVVPSAAAE